MTVNTSKITSGPYIGNGLTDTFSYTFRATNKSELKVYETDDVGVVTLLNVDTDYTVAGVGVDAGGSITRVAGALPNNYEWFIRSNYQVNQLTAFTSQGAYFPDLHENVADKLTFLVQQLQNVTDRSLKFSDWYSGDPSTVTPLPDPDPGLYFRWNGAGSAVEYAGIPGSIVPSNSFATVADMIADTGLQVGDVVLTFGFSTKGDGGDAYYEIFAAGTGTHNGKDYIDLAGSGLQAKAWFKGDIRGEGGKSYKIVACVLRQDTVSSGWYAIDDANHTPLNVSAVSMSAGKIQLDYDFTAEKIVSFVATPDEAYAQLGLTCGATVDVGQAFIEVGAPLQFKVTFNGTTSPVLEADEWWTNDPLLSASVSLSSGALTVGHPATLSTENQPIVKMFEGSDQDVAVIDTSSRTSFLSYVVGPIATRVYYDGAAWQQEASGPSFSTFYNATNGMVLQYGSDPSTDVVFGAQVTQYGNGTYTPYIRVQEAGNLFVKFKDDAGTIQTALSTNMDFSVTVPGKFRDKNPQGSIFFDRGHCAVDATYLAKTLPDVNAGNIWVFGIFEV